jgi:CheY-like chemotaxis protein
METSSSAARSCRVLVVDDNHDAAKTFVMVLRTWGLDAHMATNGAEALRLLHEVDPHAVFLDLCMPEMNGFELARHIRALPDGHRHLLVALTAYSDDGHRKTAHAAGFNDFMTKPADLKILRTLLGVA